MLATISRALEERDQTQGHGDRVAALAEPVARRLGWDSKRLDGLRLGAVVHDIGKLSVRAELLRKSGLLTTEERAAIETHPSAGATLLAPLRFAREALPYVLFHHERWEGGGYPTGMSGHCIPIEGRVLAVADAFDAMTSSRPYRPAVSIDRALAEIAICAGSQFDPVVAEAFLEVWAEQTLAFPTAVAS